jgi:hypothetical protein
MDWMRGLIRDRLAGDTTPAPPAPSEEDDDMPLTDDDLKRIARAVAAYQNDQVEPSRDVYQIQRDASSYAKQAAEQTKDLSSTGLTDAQLDTLADKVADKLAARLAD